MNTHAAAIDDLSLLDACILRHPAGTTIDDRCLRLSLKPSASVARVALEFKEPLDISSFTHLNFTLSEREAGSILASLILGDIGLPEIRIVTEENSVWRFKRGNHKDFFDLQRASDPQLISLPLRFFIYDTDTKTNVLNSIPFLVSRIRLILIDFLPSKSEPIAIDLQDPRLVRMPIAAKPRKLFDHARFSSSSRTNGISPFYTNDGVIGVSLSLDRALFEPVVNQAVLRIDKFDCDDVFIDSADVRITSLRQNFSVRLPYRGLFRLRLTVVHNEDVVAAQDVGCGHGIDSERIRDSILGISDDGFEDEIGLMGGRFQRRVAGYRSVIVPSDGTPLRWAGRTPPLPTSRPVPLQDMIVSMKAMPDFLSKARGAADSYRYGPSDFDVFANIVRFIASEMSRSGYFFMEAWNEASVRHEWNDDTETLIELYRVVYQVCKSVDPRIQVLTGTTHTFDYAFIEKILSAGAGRYMDGLALHGYTYQPLSLADDIARAPALLQYYAGQFENPSNLGSVPIYLTEIGFRSPAFSLQDQAKWLSTATLLASCHENYKAVLWFRLQNRYDSDMDEYEQNQSTGYAMVEFSKRGVRPSLLAYRMTAAFLDVFPRGTYEASATDGSLGFRFTSRSGAEEASVYVADNVTMTVPHGCLALDSLGRLLGRSGVAISSSRAPIYVIPARVEQALLDSRLLS